MGTIALFTVARCSADFIYLIYLFSLSFSPEFLVVLDFNFPMLKNPDTSSSTACLAVEILLLIVFRCTLSFLIFSAVFKKFVIVLLFTTDRELLTPFLNGILFVALAGF